MQVRLQINYARHDRSRDTFEDHVPGTDQRLQDLSQLRVNSEEQEHGSIQVLPFLVQLLWTLPRRAQSHHQQQGL